MSHRSTRDRRSPVTTDDAERAETISGRERLRIWEPSPSSPNADPGLALDRVDQFASQDAASGAWDVDALLALDHRLPGETEIERMTERIAQEAQQAKPQWAAGGEHQVQLARTATPGSDGRVRTEAELADELDHVDAALAALAAERAAAARVLRGEEQRDGVSWQGSVPRPVHLSAGEPERRVRWRTAVLTDWFVRLGATLLGGLTEGVIVTYMLMGQLKTDSPWLPIAFALPIVVGLALVPHAVGVAAVTARRAARPRQHVLTAAVLAVFWLLVVVFLAHQRADYVREARGDTYARSHHVDLIAVPSAAYGSWAWDFAFWIAALLGVGAGVIAVKLVAYNPLVHEVLDIDTELAVLRRRRVFLRSEAARVTGIVAVQETVATENASAWEHYRTHTIPALRLEMLARYRRQLINALGSPEATTAVAITPDVAALGHGPHLPAQGRHEDDLHDGRRHETR